MGFMQRVLVGAAASALILSSAPAMAGGYGGISVGSGYGGFGYGLGVSSSWGGGRGWGRHRHHDRVDAGDVIGAIAVIGVIAAIASAGSKKNRDRSERTDRDYPSRNDDRRSSSEKRISNEDDAAYACADAAEERGGEGARVRDITDVRKSGDGWDVDGVVSRRSTWRDKDGTGQRFSCRVRFGSVEDVRFEDDKVALNAF
jgi:hypothetical protein